MLNENYKGRNGIIFGVNNFYGREISNFLSQNYVNLGLIDLDAYKDAAIVNRRKNYENKMIYNTVISGNEISFQRAVEEVDDHLGGIDYLICSYYLEEARKKTDPENLSTETWDTWFEEWILNYFLIMKAAVPLMIKKKGGRIVFMNTTSGYTGEGEITGEGSIHENACSSGITGMMTSIARDIIPQGVSVNGIALGPDYRNDVERIIWATHLWLSGMGEYSCGQILKLY